MNRLFKLSLILTTGLFLVGCVNNSNLSPEIKKKIANLEKIQTTKINKNFHLDYFTNNIIGNSKSDRETILQAKIIKILNQLTNKINAHPPAKVTGFIGFTVYFPQKAYPRETKYGLRENIYTKIDEDKNTVELIKIESSIEFNPFTAGLTSISNDDDLKRLIKLDLNFKKILLNEFDKINKSKSYWYLKPITLNFKVPYKDKTIFIDTYKDLFQKINLSYLHKSSPSFYFSKKNKLGAIRIDKNYTLIVKNYTLYKQTTGLKINLECYIIGKISKNNDLSKEIIKNNLINLFKNSSTENTFFKTTIDLDNMTYNLLGKKYSVINGNDDEIIVKF